MKFSDHLREKKLQKGYVELSLRNRLWNRLIEDMTYFDGKQRHITLAVILEHIYDLILKEPLDEIPNQNKLKLIKENFYHFDWMEVYDFLEIVLNLYRSNPFGPAPERYRKYISDFNRILEEENSAYRIINGTQIEEIPPYGLNNLVDIKLNTNDPKNIDDRVKIAIDKYFNRGADLEDKKSSIIQIGDVLEYLKSKQIINSLPKKATGDLFHILNRYDFRHHNIDQISDYNKEIWYEWIFFTSLSTVYTLLNLNKY